MSQVRANLAKVRERIQDAAARAGRDADEITLMGVSKRQPDANVFEAFDAGLRHFGENTVQEFTRKAALFSEKGFEPHWHFIGHLQRNKINALLGQKVYRVHSVGTTKLGEALNKRAPSDGLDILIEVNIGREEQKDGVLPEHFAALLDSISTCQQLRLRGLMAIPPPSADPRPMFESLTELRDHHRNHPAMTAADELSIGMSNDFEAAIECGSTIVRVGTAIFGPRPS